MKKNIAIILIILIVGIIGGLTFKVNSYIQTRSLFYAIEKQDIAQVEATIHRGANINSNRYVFAFQEAVWHNPTPLIQACMVGNQDIVEILVKNGADINQCDVWVHQSPLSYTLKNNKPNRFTLAKYLIDNGADFHTGFGESTALLESITILDTDDSDTVKESFALFEYLIEHGADTSVHYGVNTLFTYACSENENVPVIDYLLKNQYVDVNEIDGNGMTGLIISAKYGAEQVCQLLLQYGADQTIHDNQGKTALDYAKEGQNGVLSLLE